MKLLKSTSHGILATPFILAACACSLQAQIIAQWTFEDSFAYIQANSGPAVTLTGVVPETGAGSALGVHASPATVWSSPAGNGSSHSLSANNWAQGDYYQFQTSTLGLNNITLSYDQASSSTGPGNFSLSYSTDGQNFTTLQTYSVLQNGASPNPSWNGTTSTSVYSHFLDLSPVADLNNAAAVYFRVVNSGDTTPSGGAIGTGGTDRIDNFTVAVVPEPRGLFVVGGLAFLIARMRHGRRS